MAIIIKGNQVAGVGKPGESAYEIALRAGYQGSEEQFAAELNDAVNFDEFLTNHNLDVNAHPFILELIDEKIAAIPTPDVSGQIEEHNSSSTAHNDIRIAITNATNTAVAAQTTADNAANAAAMAQNTANSKQDASTAINTGNIGSQSVNYANSTNWANSAGNANTLGGLPYNSDPHGWGFRPILAGTADMTAGVSQLDKGVITKEQFTEITGDLYY